MRRHLLTALLALFSDQVEASSQGWVMGITESIFAFVWAVNGVAVGALVTLNAKLPIYISAFTLLLTILLNYIFHKYPDFLCFHCNGTRIR